MRSALRGKNTLGAEVTIVSSHGLWLWLGDREVFVSYERFPWFKDASVGQVLNVHRVSLTHLHWPDLDIDIHVESIDRPDEYPLVSKPRPHERMQPTRKSRRGAAVSSRSLG